MDQHPSNEVVAEPAKNTSRQAAKSSFPKLDQADLRRRFEERNRQQASLREQAAKDRREGRKKGVLAHGTFEGLRACNLLQLKTARKLIERFEKEQRNPPSLADCKQTQTVKVLADKCLRNKRYTLELRRSSRKRGKVYVNGPYAVEHHRDGNIVHHIYVGNKSLSTKLPRNVWSTFRPLMRSEDIRSIIARENAKWAAQEDD